MNLDRDIWFTEVFNKQIPWKQLIQKKPEILTTQEIEEYFNVEDFDKVLPYRLVEKLSKEYILNHTESLLKFSRDIFRNGHIDQEFVSSYATDSDWFQLAFNTQFNWSLEFLVDHLDKFESNYGLSRNEKLFDALFGSASKEEIESLLKAY